MTKDEERIDKTLSGRAAIVTGSTSGIGLAIARALAGSGANVVLNGFGDLKEIEKIRNSILNQFGTAVIYVPADMAQPTDIVRLVETTAETFGRVDILVNTTCSGYLSRPSLSKNGTRS